MRLDRVYGWLMTPVHGSTLGVFRVVYAYVMLAQILKWTTMFSRLQTSVYVFPYAGVSWIHPVSPYTGNLMLAVCFLSSVFLGLGLFTRVAAITNFLLFGYLFHICQSFFNNHYVLMCHINFVGCFLDWETWGSLDSFLKRRNSGGRSLSKTVPYWQLLLMQLLFCIPYFFGGIAKMNSDWLFRAQPLISWFAHRSGYFYRQWWFPWFIAWNGMLYDLTISFFLMYRPTRYLIGFPGALFFNICNKLMFNIGVFPFTMVASLVLFLDPDIPQRVWNLFTVPPPPSNTRQTSQEDTTTDAHTEEIKYKEKKRSPWYQAFVFIFVGGFLIFHSIYPLRHFFLFKSNPSWTEEGHIGAWHMKLRTKTGWTILEMEEMNGKITKLIPTYDPHLTHAQLAKVSARPHVFLHYLDKLNLVFQEADRPLKSIKVRNCMSLNGNSYRKLFVSGVNMLDYVGKYEFVTTSAVGRWLHAFEDAPRCNASKLSMESNSLWNQTKTDYRLLYKEANMELTSSFDAYGNKPFVYHRTVLGDGHVYKQPAYTWKA